MQTCRHAETQWCIDADAAAGAQVCRNSVGVQVCKCAGVQVSRWCAGVQMQQCRSAEVERCSRSAGVQRCKVCELQRSEVQSCRGGEVHGLRDAEVQRGAEQGAGEVQKCRGALM